MKKKFSLPALIILLIIAPVRFMGQDSIQQHEEGKKVEGFKPLPIPVIGYNVDIGFQYGIILNLYNYGDGSLYPEYKYSFYTEVSRTTKGSGVNQLFFDSKYILPYHIRMTADMSYLTELTLDFYGMNGYDAVYKPEFTDLNSEQYKSRLFYNYDRRFIRFTTDFQHSIGKSKFLWLAGLGYFDIRVGRLDIGKLNKGKKEADWLPDTALLYDKYRQWGLIDDDEAKGGPIPSVKVGFIYDTRDNEPNPMKGTWTEVLLFYVPEILGNKNWGYTKLAITHRQYFTLVKKKVNLCYRLGYQGTILGKVPFYMQPYMITSFAKVTTTDGLGGAKTIRGVMRNRVVGDGVAYVNIELRWKFYRGTLFKQDIYLAVNSILDAGQVVQKTELPDDLDTRLDPVDHFSDYFIPGSERMHASAGAGFQIVFFENAVIDFEYGKAIDKRDGNGGFYIGIGYIF